MNINYKLYTILTYLLVPLFCACSKDNKISNSQIDGSTSAETVSSTILPHSMKGYELYSWQENDEWYFTLITGTNRTKTIDEVTLYHSIITEDGWINIRVQGVEALKTLLNRIPKKEYLFWVSPQWFRTMEGQPGSFIFPPQNVVDDIKEYCKQLGIELNVGT